MTAEKGRRALAALVKIWVLPSHLSSVVIPKRIPAQMSASS